MPQLIPHPETLRRQTQRDVYFISELPDRSRHGPVSTLRDFAFPSALADWLTLHMPDVRWGKVGPRELSGWLVGGPISYFLTMNSEQAAQYERHWERPDPIDRLKRDRDAVAGFRCYLLPFQPWRQRLDASAVHAGAPSSNVSTFAAWQTPSEGVLWAEMVRARSPIDGDDPRYSIRDLWLRATELYPSLLTAQKGGNGVVEAIVHRCESGIDCLLLSPPDLPDGEVFSESNVRGARTNWQLAFCDALGLDRQAVWFGWGL